MASPNLASPPVLTRAAHVKRLEWRNTCLPPYGRATPLPALAAPQSPHANVMPLSLPALAAQLATTSQSLATTSQPLVTTSKPPATTSQPKPPATTPQPPTTASQPPATTSKPLAAMPQPKPLATTSQPPAATTPQPKPPATTPQPKPLATTSKPPATTSQPHAHASSQSPATTSQPPATTSQPLATTSKPLAATPQPKPLATTSQPPATTSQPPATTSQPKPPATTPQPKPPATMPQPHAHGGRGSLLTCGDVESNPGPAWQSGGLSNADTRRIAKEVAKLMAAPVQQQRNNNNNNNNNRSNSNNNRSNSNNNRSNSNNNRSNRTQVAAQQRSSEICRDFQRGQCSRRVCKFSHDEDSPQQLPQQQQQQQRQQQGGPSYIEAVRRSPRRRGARTPRQRSRLLTPDRRERRNNSRPNSPPAAHRQRTATPPPVQQAAPRVPAAVRAAPQQAAEVKPPMSELATLVYRAGLESRAADHAAVCDALLLAFTQTAMKALTPVVEALSTLRTPCVCPDAFCTRVFKDETSLAAHVESVHPDHRELTMHQRLGNMQCCSLSAAWFLLEPVFNAHPDVIPDLAKRLRANPMQSDVDELLRDVQVTPGNPDSAVRVAEQLVASDGLRTLFHRPVSRNYCSDCGNSEEFESTALHSPVLQTGGDLRALCELETSNEWCGRCVCGSENTRASDVLRQQYVLLEPAYGMLAVHPTLFTSSASFHLLGLIQTRGTSGTAGHFTAWRGREQLVNAAGTRCRPVDVNADHVALLLYERSDAPRLPPPPPARRCELGELLTDRFLGCARTTCRYCNDRLRDGECSSATCVGERELRCLNCNRQLHRQRCTNRECPLRELPMVENIFHPDGTTTFQPQQQPPATLIRIDLSATFSWLFVPLLSEALGFTHQDTSGASTTAGEAFWRAVTALAERREEVLEFVNNNCTASRGGLYISPRAQEASQEAFPEAFATLHEAVVHAHQQQRRCGTSLQLTPSLTEVAASSSVPLSIFNPSETSSDWEDPPPEWEEGIDVRTTRPHEGDMPPPLQQELPVGWNCTICGGEEDEEEGATSLAQCVQCAHLFHHGCMTQWAMAEFARCPDCRAFPFPDAAVDAAAATVTADPTSSTPPDQRPQPESIQEESLVLFGPSQSQQQNTATSALVSIQEESLVLFGGSQQSSVPLAQAPQQLPQQPVELPVEPATDSPRSRGRPRSTATATAAPSPPTACTCPGREEGTRGRHLISCPRSAAARTNSVAVQQMDAAARNRTSTTSASIPPLGPSAEAPSTGAPAQHENLPSLAELSRLAFVPLIDAVPPSVAGAVAEALASILADTTPRMATLLAAFPRAVLSKPRRRGRRNSLTATITLRLRRWALGQGAQLLRESLPPQPRQGDEQQQRNRAGVAAAVRAERLAQAGLLRKAAQALRPAVFAPADGETSRLLRELHPQRHHTEGWVLPPLPAPRERLQAEPALVSKCLQQFLPDTAAGPSLLKPYTLRQLSEAHPRLLGAITGLVNKLMNGDFSATADGGRHFFFAARGFALLKDGSTASRRKVRPIACGEVWRRLAAKCILAIHRNDIRTITQRAHQYGVSTSSGREHIVFKLSDAAEALAPNEVILQVDFANGFNAVHRETILTEAAARLPSMYPFIRAGLEGQPEVVFESCTIASDEGSQQGNPCGPLEFALAAASVDPLLDPVCSWRGWYIDDLSVITTVDQLPALTSTINSFASVGLHINPSKTRVVCHEEARERVSAALGTVHDENFDSPGGFRALGSPIGVDAFIDDQIDAFSTLQEGLVEKIAEIENTHVQSKLLRACASFAPAVHLMRSCGSSPAWVRYDRMLRPRIEFALVGSGVHNDTYTQFLMPKTLGGSGFRNTADFAPIAYLCCRSAVGVSSSAPPPHRIAVNLLTDAARLSNLTLEGISAAVCFQREHSQTLCELQRAELLHNSSETDRRRNLSTGQRSTTNWEHAVTLSSREWWSHNRFRYGLRLYAEETDCPGCGEVCDVYGSHVASCTAGGLKIAVHNPLVATLNQLGTEAGVYPQRETRAFSGEHAGLRVDLGFAAFCHGRDALVDVAVVNPLQDRFVRDPAAALSSGAAATIYEQIKRDHYEPAMDHQRQMLVPCIIESHGAFSVSAFGFVKALARSWAHRRNVPQSVAISRVFGRVAATLHIGIARALCAALPQELATLATDEGLQEQGDGTPAAGEHGPSGNRA